MKKVGDIKLNDGGGLYDNEGLCDSLIMDCNNAVKTLTGGNYILFCNIMVQMVRKLDNLKKGIASDIGRRDQTIKDLNIIIDKIQENATGLPVDNGEMMHNGTD